MVKHTVILGGKKMSDLHQFLIILFIVISVPVWPVIGNMLKAVKKDASILPHVSYLSVHLIVGLLALVLS